MKLVAVDGEVILSEHKKPTINPPTHSSFCFSSSVRSFVGSIVHQKEEGREPPPFSSIPCFLISSETPASSGNLPGH
jgi:hypothetical protein